jgi:hypothetical protein
MEVGQMTTTPPNFGDVPWPKGPTQRSSSRQGCPDRHYRSGIFASSGIGLSTARQVSSAGMTQAISAHAIGLRPASSGGCHADVA